MVVIHWFFFFKQKTAYEMRISDWSSDVCSSDLVHAPRLEIAAVRTARNLAIGALSGQPDFEVIGLARRESHVARAQPHPAIGQVQRLQDRLGGARLALQLGIRILGADDRDEFDLPELVLSETAARVGPGGASFGPDAGSDRCHADGQVGQGPD